jgi:hypothetical protein
MRVFNTGIKILDVCCYMLAMRRLGFREWSGRLTIGKS